MLQLVDDDFSPPEEDYVGNPHDLHVNGGRDKLSSFSTLEACNILSPLMRSLASGLTKVVDMTSALNWKQQDFFQNISILSHLFSIE